jgi:hypothetical protein
MARGGGGEDYLIAYCPETVGAGGLGETCHYFVWLAVVFPNHA